MIDWTKAVQTRDGRKVEILGTGGRGSYPVVGYVGDSTVIREWHINGSWCSPTRPAPLDLINVPETRVVWVNVYEDYIGGGKSKEEADENAGADRLACIRVPCTIGQFDDEEPE